MITTQVEKYKAMTRRKTPFLSVCMVIGLVAAALLSAEALATTNGNEETALTTAAGPINTRANHRHLKSDTPPSPSQQYKLKVAYVVSLTSCQHDGAKDAAGWRDSAAVLKQSIHNNSFRAKPDETKYDYHMMALIHPDADKAECVDVLEAAGYEIVRKEMPFRVEDIEGDYLRENLRGSGCCGETEFMKLYTYTLTEYPIAVHLDLDTILFQPMDKIFDAMLELPDPPSSTHNIHKVKHLHQDSTGFLPPAPKSRLMYRSRLQKAGHIKKYTPLMDDAHPIEVAYTLDMGPAKRGDEYVNMQGGFFIVKPNMEIFNEMLKLIVKGDFHEEGGWAGKYGRRYGDMQVQGFMTYYYTEFHPEHLLVLNDCIYDNTYVHSKYLRSYIDQDDGRLRTTVQAQCDNPTERETCHSCRTVSPESIVLGHFTVCRKPFLCHSSWDHGKDDICAYMTKEWNQIRYDLESLQIQQRQLKQSTSSVQSASSFLRSGGPVTIEMKFDNEQLKSQHSCQGDFFKDIFHGCCKFEDYHGYTSIPLYDVPIVK